MKSKRVVNYFIFVIFLLLIVFSSGCWDRRELNELAIVSAAGVDFGQKDDEISFIYQIVNASIAGNKSNGNQVPFITQVTSGKTIFEATAKANIELPRELYFDHLQTFLIGYGYAKENGIKDILDGLYRTHKVRENIYILIAQDKKLENVLSTLTTLETINGNYIKSIMDNAYKHASATRVVELREVVSTLASTTKSLVIPLINVNVTGQNNIMDNVQTSLQKAILKVEGFAVFKEDKIIGTLDYEEAMPLNCITDKLNNAICIISYKGANHSIEIVESKSKIKTDIKNGQPKVSIDVKHMAKIEEINAPIDLSNPEVIKSIEHEVDKKINDAITSLIEKVQTEFKVDIFGFGEAFERQNPKEWKKLEDDWEEHFANLKVEVKVNTAIREIGMKNNSLQGKLKEKDK